MKCVILQPSYIPWRGYFDQILQADVFVFYDDVQYDKHGWRNRNRVKTHQGPVWLTVPVFSKGAVSQHILINQVEINHRQPWNHKHLRTLQQAYGKAPHFERYAGMLDRFYSDPPRMLADFNIELIIALARELGIQHTRFIRSSELEAGGQKTDRLITILEKLGADHYISGPSARDYIEPEKFATAGIQLAYMQYNYPEYSQLYPPYDPQLSILDLLFMTGPAALSYIQPKSEKIKTV
jgi:WbqC-like protein family